MGQWRVVAEIPVDTRAPRMARRVVGALLDGWQLESLSDDAQLVVSELVSNAVEHAGGAESFELEIVCHTDVLRISLADGSSIRPVVQELDHDRPRGRGMRLVEMLTDGWGADDHHGGKRVWVELRVPALLDTAESRPGA